MIKLGATGLEVSELCFGANVFGWTCDQRQSFTLLDALWEHGINFIDTANNYSHWVPGNSGGESEQIIGKWLFENKRRHDVILSTKVGGSMQGVERGLSKAQIVTGVEGSLRRLKTDYIDVYFAHHDDLNQEVDVIMESFNLLVQQGKVRYLGASNVSAERILQSNTYAQNKGIKGYDVIQPLYNLFDRQSYEQQYRALAQEQGLGVMSYFALASGFLSGKYKSVEDTLTSKRKDFLSAYFDSRGLAILKALEDVSRRNGVSIPTVAIAWQMHREVRISPVVSATSKVQLQELLQSIRFILTPQDRELLDEASKY